MSFFVRDCVRCGVKKIHHSVVGYSWCSTHTHEVVGRCQDCHKTSIYVHKSGGLIELKEQEHNIEMPGFTTLSAAAVYYGASPMVLSEYIPDRIAGLFREANECRQMTWYEAAGSMYRKTLDVATKHIFSHDPRLAEKNPANALRSRIKAMGELGILEQDIVELADIVALDGNDAVHDEDPYTKEEAEALEDLTLDLLDRLFVRPAKIAAVKAKQIASGQRPAE